MALERTNGASRAVSQLESGPNNHNKTDFADFSDFTLEGFLMARRWAGLAVALLTGLLAATPGVTAVSPCPTLLYAVSSSGTRCNVTLQNDPFLAISYLWWANASSGGYDMASSHLNRTATSAEPITYIDGDGNGALSRGDVIEVYTGNGCGGNLLVVLGPDVGSASASQTLVLQDGYQTACSSGTGDTTLPVVVAVVAIGVAACVAALMAARRRRR